MAQSLFMLSRLHHWSQHLLARLPAVLPSSCALCGVTNPHTICVGCRNQYFKPRRHCCPRCAMPHEANDPALRCGACLDHPPAFDATIAAADYGAPIDQLVVSLKFGGRLALAPMFARMMRDALLQAPAPQQALPMILAPVPLGGSRLAQRGFNQALEIARPLSRSLGIKLEPRLAIRLRDTEAQSTLRPEQRRQNLRDAFAVSHDFIDSIRDQHVGIVDDVMTTGETLNELAATLKRFGAARVTNYVFARTLLK
jgi:ComF family protein